MPQWAGSCWYYLRYLDPRNDGAPWDAAKERYWMPVDLYVGGVEHAVLHLLYARFWHKVLFDLGLVSTTEPFRKLVNQGLILGEDGEKMSKSRGNVVNPDVILDDYGSDAFRLYEMYMGPLERVKPWKTSGMEGMRRFLERLWRLLHDAETDAPLALDDAPLAHEESLRVLHQSVRKVTDDLERMRFNTAIAQLITCVNVFTKNQVRHRDALATLVLLVSPLAPHIGEELWRRLGRHDTLAYEPWPGYDPDLARSPTFNVAVQVNGKVRAVLEVEEGTEEEEVKARALGDATVVRHMEGRTPRRVVYVPGRIVSVVL
jgi:leucyl-tRNA synthetase